MEKYLNRKSLTLSIVTVTCIGIFIVVFLVLAPQNNDPKLLALTYTNKLLVTSKDLSKSLGERPANYAATTETYIKYMDKLSGDCKVIRNSFSNATKSGVSGDTMVLLKATESLCKDLVDIADTSAYTYRTVLPVLSDSSTIKRYQTLPIIKRHVIHDHRRDTEIAINSLKSGTHKDDLYVQGAIEELNKLKSSMQIAQGFSYTNKMDSVQAQLVVDRNQYWNAYSDLNGLIKALENQLVSYCNTYKDDKNPPSLCEPSGDPYIPARLQ